MGGLALTSGPRVPDDGPSPLVVGVAAPLGATGAGVAGAVAPGALGPGAGGVVVIGAVVLGVVVDNGDVDVDVGALRSLSLSPQDANAPIAATAASAIAADT